MHINIPYHTYTRIHDCFKWRVTFSEISGMPTLLNTFRRVLNSYYMHTYIYISWTFLADICIANIIRFFFKLNHSTNKCGTNCAICRHLKEGSIFEDNQNNTCEVKDNISCKTFNLIHGIYCNKCMKLQGCQKKNVHSYFLIKRKIIDIK